MKQRIRTRLSPPRGERGFTLAEMLVVLVIIALLAALVGPRLMGVLGGAKTKTATTQIANFAASLDIFRVAVGRYPTSEEGLEALVVRPTDVQGWDGPYINKSTVPRDPWGRPYGYESLNDGAAYRIVTLGADNAVGGEGENADIASDQ